MATVDSVPLTGTVTGTSTVADSLRDRKKSATRKAIEDSAWELFGERGYAATSVDDIAERAGVAPRTFFRYFPTKEAVLYGEADEAIEALATAFRARPADEPLGESLVAAIEEVTSRFQKDRAKMVKRFEMQRAAGLDDMGESVRQRFAKQIADLVREREADLPNVELRARVVASALMATNAVATDYWLEGGAKGEPGECFGDCLSMLRSIFSSSPPPR